MDNGLPKINDHWVTRRKAAVVRAIIKGSLSESEALRRYRMMPDELASWRHMLEQGGTAALRSTRLQILLPEMRYCWKATNPLSEAPWEIPFQQLMLDRKQNTLRAGTGDPQGFYPIESDILAILILKRGTVVARQALLHWLYPDQNMEPNQKVIEVHIYNIAHSLRAFCGENPILYVWGRGYMLPPAP